MSKTGSSGILSSSSMWMPSSWKMTATNRSRRETDSSTTDYDGRNLIKTIMSRYPMSKSKKDDDTPECDENEISFRAVRETGDVLSPWRAKSVFMTETTSMPQISSDPIHIDLHKNATNLEAELELAKLVLDTDSLTTQDSESLEEQCDGSSQGSPGRGLMPWRMDMDDITDHHITSSWDEEEIVFVEDRNRKRDLTSRESKQPEEPNRDSPNKAKLTTPERLHHVVGNFGLVFVESGDGRSHHSGLSDSSSFSKEMKSGIFTSAIKDWLGNQRETEQQPVQKTNNLHGRKRREEKLRWKTSKTKGKPPSLCGSSVSPFSFYRNEPNRKKSSEERWKTLAPPTHPLSMEISVHNQDAWSEVSSLANIQKIVESDESCGSISSFSGVKARGPSDNSLVDGLMDPQFTSSRGRRRNKKSDKKDRRRAGEHNDRRHSHKSLPVQSTSKRHEDASLKRTSSHESLTSIYSSFGNTLCCSCF